MLFIAHLNIKLVLYYHSIECLSKCWHEALKAAEGDTQWIWIIIYTYFLSCSHIDIFTPSLLLCLCPLSGRNTIKQVIKIKQHLHRLPSRHLSTITGASVGPQPGPWQPRSYKMRWDLCDFTGKPTVCLHCSQKHCCSISHRGGADTLARWQVSELVTDKHTPHTFVSQSLGTWKQHLIVR